MVAVLRRTTNGAGEVWHLARRFFGSVRPGTPSEVDMAWVESVLTSAEMLLWVRMSNPDKRHAVQVGRSVEAVLGQEATTPILVAALLHDVGKIQSAYRTPARCVATVIWTVLANDLAEPWSKRTWPLKRLGQYRRHPEIGEELLRSAGSADLSAQWAGDHHRPTNEWRVDQAIGQVLKDCDDD